MYRSCTAAATQASAKSRKKSDLFDVCEPLEPTTTATASDALAVDA
jgi:hypothetical protein